MSLYAALASCLRIPSPNLKPELRYSGCLPVSSVPGEKRIYITVGQDCVLPFHRS
jgi:hypothetical protein